MLSELARRIKAARAYAGVTQEDMASRLDISPVTYKRIESGKRDVSTLEIERIAEITGWPVDMFAGELRGGPQAEEQLEELQHSMSDMVARLADIEFRMRQVVEPPRRVRGGK